MAKDGIFTKAKHLTTATLDESTATIHSLLRTTSTVAQVTTTIARETLTDLQTDLLDSKLNYASKFAQAKTKLIELGFSQKEAEAYLKLD